MDFANCSKDFNVISTSNSTYENPRNGLGRYSVFFAGDEMWSKIVYPRADRTIGVVLAGADGGQWSLKGADGTVWLEKRCSTRLPGRNGKDRIAFTIGLDLPDQVECGAFMEVVGAAIFASLYQS